MRTRHSHTSYEGVVSTSATLDAQNRERSQESPKIQAKFRTSMKKVSWHSTTGHLLNLVRFKLQFNASPATGTSFSIVGFSQPYSFGRLKYVLYSLPGPTQNELTR